MAGQRVSFEWNTLEDEFSWRRLLANENLEPKAVASYSGQSADRWMFLQLARSAALLFVAIIAIAGAGSSPVDLENIRLRNEIQNALHAEEEAKLAANQALLDQLIDPRLTGGWRRIWRAMPLNSEPTNQKDTAITLIRTETFGGWVMAEVSVNQPAYGWSQTEPYREIRFYRETTGGWLRSIPDDAFWGNQQASETAHLRFEYRSHEANLIEANSNRLEEIYASLHNMLALEMAPSSEKITFVTSLEVVNETGNLSNRIQIVSPLLSQIPDGFSRDEYFVQTVVNHMAYLAINRKIASSRGLYQRGGSSYRWRNMQIGLRRWLRIELLGMATPWEQRAIRFFEAQPTDSFPLTLGNISEEDLDLLPDRNYRYWHGGAAISLIDYMVDTYGEEILPLLVRGLQSDRRWPELIPYLIDKSAVEFEAEWHEHLAR